MSDNQTEVRALVSSWILWQHGLALLLLWTCAGLSGLALLPWLRLGVGFVAAPLLGVVYWTVALYLLPFSGGLDAAAGILAFLAGMYLLRGGRTRGWVRVWKRFSWSTLVLVLGSLPYLTTLLFHHLPLGMDASMHTTAAALIARSRGLPSDYAPFSPEVA